MVNCGIKILKGEVKESLDTGKISPLLYKQLMCLYLNGLFSPDFVLREIRYLEGIDTNKTTTNTHKFFKNKPLLGLCKKHFFAPHNIENNFTTILSKNNVEIFLKNKFNIDVAKTDFSNSMSRNKLIKNILYATISNPNKTGDWLIYEKYDWGNYYISLAQHEERDIEIYDRIKNYIGKFNS